jgi:hypothetical protein
MTMNRKMIVWCLLVICSIITSTSVHPVRLSTVNIWKWALPLIVSMTYYMGTEEICQQLLKENNKDIKKFVAQVHMQEYKTVYSTFVAAVAGFVGYKIQSALFGIFNVFKPVDYRLYSIKETVERWKTIIHTVRPLGHVPAELLQQVEGVFQCTGQLALIKALIDAEVSKLGLVLLLNQIANLQEAYPLDRDFVAECQKLTKTIRAMFGNLLINENAIERLLTHDNHPEINLISPQPSLV